MLTIESSSADVLQMMSWMTTLAIQILVPMTVVGCAIREPLTVNCMAQSSVSHAVCIQLLHLLFMLPPSSGCNNSTTVLP